MENMPTMQAVAREAKLFVDFAQERAMNLAMANAALVEKVQSLEARVAELEEAQCQTKTTGKSTADNEKTTTKS